MENRAETVHHHRQIAYNDFPIRIFLALIAAHIMVMYNETDTFFEALFTMSYFRGFVASFVIASIIIWYVYRTTVSLDKRYSWHGHTLLRLILQTGRGLALPAILAFLLVAIFLRMYGINILETEYLRQDYPLVLLMLLSINLYYFGLYCFLVLKKPTVPDQKILTAEDNVATPTKEQANNEPAHKETIIVTTPRETIPVNTDDIVYIYLVNEGVFIRLKNMKDINESYQTNYSLKDLETILDPSKFFRINRQMIVSFQSVISFRPESAKTLLLTLNPEMFPVKKDTPAEYQRLTIVSENRTPRFKLWIDR